MLRKANLPELGGVTNEPYQPHIKNRAQSTALHEGIQVHLERIQGVGRGHGVGKPLPEEDDSVC